MLTAGNLIGDCVGDAEGVPVPGVGGGNGKDISITVPSTIPCANLIGAPANVYDDDIENPSEERQVVVAPGTAVKVNDADDPSETISSTPAMLTLNPGQARPKLRS